MQEEQLKKQFILHLPYILFAYIANKLCWLYRVNKEETAYKIVYVINHWEEAFQYPLPSLFYQDLFFGIVVAMAIWLVLWEKRKNAKKFRHGVEYGSARWGTRKDIEPYMDETFQNNLILSKSEYLTMSSRPPNPKYARNKNVLIVGGSGSGKTRFWL